MLSIISYERKLSVSNITLLHHQIIARSQSKNTQEKQYQLFRIWLAYHEKPYSPSKLLEDVVALITDHFPRMDNLSDQQPYPEDSDVIDDLDVFDGLYVWRMQNTPFHLAGG